MKQYNFSVLNKVLFYSRYFLDKTIFLWFEVKTPKIKVFIYEFLYSFDKLVHLDLYKGKLPKNIEFIELM